MKVIFTLGQSFDLFHCDHCDSDFLIFAYWKNSDDDWEYDTGGRFIGPLVGGHCPHCGIEKKNVRG